MGGVKVAERNDGKKQQRKEMEETNKGRDNNE